MPPNSSSSSIEPLGVMHRGGDLAAVADDGRVGGQGVNLRLAHGGDGSHVEALETLLEAGPFAGNHLPRQAALEYGLGHHLQVVVEAFRDDLFRRFRVRMLSRHINVCPRFSIFLRLAVVICATSSTDTPLTSARHCATSATCRGSVQLWRYFLKG